MEQRLEKKFVFLPGDNKKIETLKIEGFFKKRTISEYGFHESHRK